MTKSILLEADELVNGARREDYGHPLDDFTRTGKMWAAILGYPVTAEQVGLCMIALKISRECNKPKRDNMLDAAGYAQTVEMCKDEHSRRNDATDTFGVLKEDIKYTVNRQVNMLQYELALQAYKDKKPFAANGGLYHVAELNERMGILKLTLTPYAPKSANPIKQADDAIGKWLSAALDDPNVCAEMKEDINAWFAAIEGVVCN